MGRKACKNVHDEEMLARALLRVLGVAKDETHNMADQLAERMEEHAP
jgi:Mn-dependent DtxR family transcriptional regulator